MKNKGNNSYFNPTFLFQKSPEYFNAKYYLLTLFTIIIYSLYTMASIPIYIYYHFFGDLGLLENDNEFINNPSLKEEFMNNFKINDISFFWNIFNNIYTIAFAFLSYLVMKNQTYSYLTIYMILQKLFIFTYLMNGNLTLIPHKTSYAFKIFHLMIIFCFVLNILYFFSYHYKKKNQKEKIVENNKEALMGKYKVNNNTPMTIDSFVNEMQLRMDMAKIKFNSIMIKLKINKIFPKIMFKPKDYYFMRKDNEKERNNEHIIRNIKGYKNINNKKNSKANNNSFQDNCSTTFGSCADSYYSKLNDDENETSPLNI
jgi:hypothetical protein